MTPRSAEEIAREVLDSPAPEHWECRHTFIRALEKAIAAAIEKDRAARGWQPIETAPRQARLLVWGNGPVRFAYCDLLGQWRHLHHAPMNSQPTHWMPIPEPPR